MRFWRMMALYNAESTTYTTTAGVPASPFNPDFSGRLVGLRTVVGADAATTLTELVQFRLTCTIWTPNSIEVGAVGTGLRTAPAMAIPAMEWPCDQPINASTSIAIEARNVTADTPVGVSVALWGLFEAQKAG